MASSTDAVDLSFSQDLSLNELFGMKDRVCVVTGGSKGVGLMMASGLVQNGAKVYIASRKPDHAVAQRLSAKGPGVCISYACDVSSRGAIEEMYAKIAADEDRIHLLINNSGATWGATFEDTPRKSWDKLINVNVIGLFDCCQVFFPLLKKAAEEESRPSTIINIGSIDGVGVPAIEEYAYTASKAAVIHLTKQLAAHLAPSGITVNCISPGLFPSKMGEQVLTFVDKDIVEQGIPLGRAGQPRDIASAVMFLAGPGGAYTTGSNVIIDGGVCIKPRM